MDNQRDPNQYCAKCHKFDKVDKNQTLDQSGGELHFGKFHGAHLNQKSLTRVNRSTVSTVTVIFRKITVAEQRCDAF